MSAKRPAQSTVVGAMFFIILLFFSLGIFYYLEQNYAQYGIATQKAWQLQQQRMNQKFSLSEAYALPVNGGYKVLFSIANEGAVPIDIVNVYLYNAVTNAASLYNVNIPLNPGQSRIVNLTQYNSTFPSVLNGAFKVSMWTSLGVGSSTVVVTGVPTSSSSAEGNVYPVAGTLTGFLPGGGIGKAVKKHNGYFTVDVTFSVVNNNPLPVTIYPNTSIVMSWIPTPSQLYQMVTGSTKSVSGYSGTIGAALSMNGGSVNVAPGGSVTLTFSNYTVSLLSSNGNGGVTNSADLYILLPEQNSGPASYTLTVRVLLSYSIAGSAQVYDMDINCGYIVVRITW
ncbi:MAG: hypothetical protein ACP5LS_06225 [Thermoprotei archaeon]